MKFRILFTFIVTLAVAGCKDQGISPSETSSEYPPYVSVVTSFFNYVAYDTSGAISATGTLSLSIYNSRVTGSWRFDDGRQGTLAGTYSGGKIQVDLYPGYADHNLILTGTYTYKTFSGEWTTYGWAILGRGQFVATVYSILVTG